MLCWRKRFAILPVAGFALALASCAPSTPLVVTAGLAARAPDALTQPCGSVQPLPNRGLAGGEIARFWGLDRMALVLCRRRHGALAAHVRAQEAAVGPGVHVPFIFGERGLIP